MGGMSSWQRQASGLLRSRTVESRSRRTATRNRMAGALPYGIYDADNHFNEPADLYERYIDPALRD